MYSADMVHSRSAPLPLNGKQYKKFQSPILNTYRDNGADMLKNVIFHKRLQWLQS